VAITSTASKEKDMARKKKEPAVSFQSLLEGRPYVPSVKTNITDTWRKFGWKPVHPQGEVNAPVQ
jgi:hypothetical protein